MKTEIKSLVKQLVKQLLEAQAAYYNGEPIMEDSVYDVYEAQLNALIVANPEFSPIATPLHKVGDSKVNGIRIVHVRPMLSIENFYTDDSFVAAAKTYGAALLEEPKRDGISSELKYINGILVQAVTRGDGTAGEDMTAQVKACHKIPQKIKTNIHDLRLRGEMVMRNSELDRINALCGKQYANTRNLVAGTLKQLDLSIVSSREIVMIPWDMYSPDEDNLLPDSAYERMKMTENFGFPLYEGERVHRNNPNEILKVLHNFLNNLSNYDIVADGVVIKVDSHKLRNILGVASKYTKYQHCFKPQNLAAVTMVKSIEYGLGRTGKVTPVAILEPVVLGGAKVSRASVCNETYMSALNLTIGCEVEILRSGDVIPYIVKVIKQGTQKIVFPNNCPSCGSTLHAEKKDKTVQHICINSYCEGKAAEQFSYVGNRETLEIDNLGDSMAAELVAYGITDLALLFSFSDAMIASKASAADLKNAGFYSGVNTLKMIKSVQNAKIASWDRWIASLNIPMIGHSLGKDIAVALNLNSGDMKNISTLFQKLASINVEKLGPEKTTAIIDWAKNPNNIKFCNDLHSLGVRPASIAAVKKISNAPLNGTVICMTGELNIGTRKEVGRKLAALGAEIVDDVRSTCNLLIAGENAGSKLTKAQKKGIKIVDESWVRKALEL